MVANVLRRYGRGVREPVPRENAGMTGADETNGLRILKLRYDGVCELCGTDLPAKTEAQYDQGRKKVRCLSCQPTAVVIESGTAGASAHRRHEHLAGVREARIEAAIAEDADWRAAVKARRPVLGRLA